MTLEPIENDVNITFEPLTLAIADIEDLTPYDIYSSSTVRDSVPAEHVYELSEALLDTLLNDDAPT